MNITIATLFFFHTVSSIVAIVFIGLFMWGKNDLSARDWLRGMLLFAVSSVLFIAIKPQTQLHGYLPFNAMAVLGYFYFLRAILTLPGTSQPALWKIQQAGVEGALHAHSDLSPQHPHLIRWGWGVALAYLALNWTFFELGWNPLGQTLTPATFCLLSIWSTLSISQSAWRELSSVKILAFCYVMSAVFWGLRAYGFMTEQLTIPLNSQWLNWVTFLGIFIGELAKNISYGLIRLELIFQDRQQGYQREIELAKEVSSRERFLSSAFLSSPTPCVITDDRFNITSLNTQAEALLEDINHPCMGRPLGSLLLFDLNPEILTSSDEFVFHTAFKAEKNAHAVPLKVKFQTFTTGATAQWVFLFDVADSAPDFCEDLVNQKLSPRGGALVCDAQGEVLFESYGWDDICNALQIDWMNSSNLWTVLRILGADLQHLNLQRIEFSQSRTADLSVHTPTGVYRFRAYPIQFKKQKDHESFALVKFDFQHSESQGKSGSTSAPKLVL